MVIRISNGCQIVLQHPADDFVLMPQRYEDCNALARCVFQLPRTRRKQTCGRPEDGLDPDPGPGYIQHQIIQAAYQNRDGEWSQDRQHEAVETVSIHAHLSTVAGTD